MQTEIANVDRKTRIVDEFVKRICAGQTTVHESRIKDFHDWGNALYETLHNPEAIINKLENGAFHPDNKHSRWMFETVVGVTLPAGVNATFEFIKNRYREAYDKLAQERAEEEREKRELEEREQAELNKTRLEKVSAILKSGERIEPDDLLFAAAQLKVPVHPRTSGSLSKHFVWITENQAARYESRSGSKSVSGACALYREVCDALKNPESV